MKLTPMRPMFRLFLVGMCCGFVFVAAAVTFIAARHDDLRATGEAFAVSAVGSAALANLWFQWWLRRKTRAADAMPADAELLDARSLRWRFILAGAAAAMAGGRGAWRSPVWWEGVVAGIVLGLLIGTAFALRYLARWEDEHGRELLQRRGKGKGDRYFFRDLHPAGSGRFTREHESVSTY